MTEKEEIKCKSDALLIFLKKGNLACKLWDKEHYEIHSPEAELVKYDENGTCYTVAVWERTKEGWEMRSVGNRFFELFEGESIFDDFTNSDNIIKLCKEFQIALDSLYGSEN